MASIQCSRRRSRHDFCFCWVACVPWGSATSPDPDLWPGWCSGGRDFSVAGLRSRISASNAAPQTNGICGQPRVRSEVPGRNAQTTGGRRPPKLLVRIDPAVTRKQPAAIAHRERLSDQRARLICAVLFGRRFARKVSRSDALRSDAAAIFQSYLKNGLLH